MRKRGKGYSYQSHLVPDVEGGYTVLVPLLPGCVSYGRTIEEATKDAKEASALHLENLAAHKQPLPGREGVSLYLNDNSLSSRAQPGSRVKPRKNIRRK